MTSDDTEIEDRINTIIENAEPAKGDPVPVPESALPSRQILIIENTTFITAGYRESTSNPTPKAAANILVTGQPSSSSDVTYGYIRFAATPDLRVPSYSSAQKRIDLWVNERHMAQVLAQMTHSSRYLWIGWFNNGHIYGDVHSAP